MRIFEERYGDRYFQKIVIYFNYMTILIKVNENIVYDGIAYGIKDNLESISFITKDGNKMDIDKGIRYSTATSNF